MFPANILFILHWLLQIFWLIADEKTHSWVLQYYVVFYRANRGIAAKKTNSRPATKGQNQVKVQTV